MLSVTQDVFEGVVQEFGYAGIEFMQKYSKSSGDNRILFAKVNFTQYYSRGYKYIYKIDTLYGEGLSLGKCNYSDINEFISGKVLYTTNSIHTGNYYLFAWEFSEESTPTRAFLFNDVVESLRKEYKYKPYTELKHLTEIMVKVRGKSEIIPDQERYETSFFRTKVFSFHIADAFREECKNIIEIRYPREDWINSREVSLYITCITTKVVSYGNKSTEVYEGYTVLWEVDLVRYAYEKLGYPLPEVIRDKGYKKELAEVPSHYPRGVRKRKALAIIADRLEQIRVQNEIHEIVLSQLHIFRNEVYDMAEEELKKINSKKDNK